METNKCKIKFDSPENIFYAGQTIKGSISIILTKKTKIKGIYFKILGYGKCSWVDLLRRDSKLVSPQKESQRTVIYSGKEEYLNEKKYILGSQTSRATDLNPGEHTYNFFYCLKSTLPSTFKGNIGSIKYKIEFVVEKAWSFDEKYVVQLSIIKSEPLYTNMISNAVFKQLTRNIGIFNGGPISLIAELQRSTIVRGKSFQIRITVDNKSNTSVEKLKLAIKQHITYKSQTPAKTTREELLKIFKKETGGVQKQTLRVFNHELHLPPCQPTDITNNIIEIIYEVHVNVILPGLYKKLELILPLTVKSHLLEMTTQSVNVNNTSIGWPTTYPSPNISGSSASSFEQFYISPQLSQGNHSSLPPGYSLNNYEVGTLTPLAGNYFNLSALNNAIPSSQQMNSINGTNSLSIVNSENSFENSGNSNISSSSNNRNNIINQPIGGEIQPPSYEELFGNSSGEKSLTSE